jgi:hypothetical protein
VQAIGRHESHYGWPSAEKDPAWQGSHNWGAIQVAKPTADNSFAHIDHDAHGKEYIGYFRKYPTDEAGASDLLRELYRRPEVRAVIDSGSATSVANAMRLSGYFEAPASGYAAAIARNAQAIANSLKEPLVVFSGQNAGAGGGKSEGGWIMLAMLVGGLYLLPGGGRR